MFIVREDELSEGTHISSALEKAAGIQMRAGILIPDNPSCKADTPALKLCSFRQYRNIDGPLAEMYVFCFEEILSVKSVIFCLAMFWAL